MSEEDYETKFVSLTDALFSICKGKVKELHIDYSIGKAYFETKDFKITIERMFESYSIYLTLFEQDIVVKLTLTYEELQKMIQESETVTMLFCKLFDVWYKKNVVSLLNEGDC